MPDRQTGLGLWFVHVVREDKKGKRKEILAYEAISLAISNRVLWCLKGAASGTEPNRTVWRKSCCFKFWVNSSYRRVNFEDRRC